MDILIATFQAVATLLGIGVLGYWVIGRKRVKSETLGFLSSLTIDVAIPCLTLSSLLLDFSTHEHPDWWRMPLWWIGFAVIALILSLILSYIVKKEYRGEFITGLWYQNGLFFPIIILVGLFGSQNQYLPLLFLFVFLHPTMMFSTYSFFYQKKGESQKINIRRLINPVIVTTIIGLGIVLIGLKPYVPEFIIDITVMVGAMASPLFMLILGGTIYNDLRGGEQGRGKIYYREIIKFIIAKNLLFPLVFLGLIILIRPEYSLALIIILQAAVPPVTAIPIFAERSGGNQALASQLVLASFLVSVISIPVVLLLFNQFFTAPV
jgi:malate permease and related proteins